MTKKSFAADAPMSLEALSDALRGPLFLPDQDGYAAEVDSFDRSVVHRPAVVVGATCADDVVAAVRYARANGLGVAVQNTGHGVSVPAVGAVFINTVRMSGFQVDAERKTARFEAGVRWQEVVTAAAKHGLAPLNGSASFVGAVSYVLGGGVGVLARRYGYAADHVRWIDVVTADGELRRADTSSHPDLFWALRGGKGNFGVVTAMEVDLVPVETLYGGALFFDGASTRAVLHAYRRWASSGLPDTLSSSFCMVPFPDVPEVPEPLRGRFVTHVRLSYVGSEEDGARLIEPLRAVATPLMDTVRMMPYEEVNSIHNDPPTPGSFYINTFQLTSFGADTVEALLTIAGPDSDHRVMVEIRQLGGALAREPEVPNAVAHRDAPFQLYAASVLGAGEDAQVLNAHARLVDIMAPWNSGHRMLNFMAGVAHTDPEDVRQAFTDEAYERLVAIKTAVDPENMFRFNHNIPPAS
jgi:FAD/FMN-containing dehydrogenase